MLAHDDLNFTHVPAQNAPLKEYDTNIMGRFICTNKSCKSSGWLSKQIAITICLYAHDKYSATVYHQKCNRCNTIGKLVPDKTSYVDRVSYRLWKWSGVDVEPPIFTSKSERGPHLSHLCEGCRRGHCREGMRGFAGT